MRPIAAISAWIVAVALVGCGDHSDPAAPLDVVREDPTNLPLRGLSEDEQAAFARGDVLFGRQFVPAQGLGPVYIRASCASCHAHDGRGPGFVERAIRVDPDGFTPAADQSAMPFGPVLRPYFVAPATRGVVAPADASPAMLRSTRVGTAVFGRGYLGAVDAAEITRIAAQQARDGRVHGRVATLPDGAIGRFGLKARIATLEGFAADAFRGDMGLTSPSLPMEVANPDALTDDQRPGVDLDAATVRDVGAYLRALALPRRAPLSSDGLALFRRAGCADCHVPSLRTARDASPALLASIDAPVFTDLLLHDMGTALADGAVEGAAGPRDWRTSPLIGVRFFRSFLHDGRAQSLDEAVRLHRGDGSDANGSVDAYAALSAGDRATLLSFVGGL